MEETKPHILIVDDEMFLRKSLMLGMRRSGWAVSMAADGHEALQLLEEFSASIRQIDVLLFDQTMPEMGGLELMSEINKRHIDVEVIAMTGSLDPYTREELEKYGCSNFLAKPFDLNALRNIAQTLIDKQGLVLNKKLQAEDG